MLSEPGAFGAHGEPASAVVHQAVHLVHPARGCDHHPAAAAVEADHGHVRFRRRETGGRDQARVRLVKPELPLTGAAGSTPRKAAIPPATPVMDENRHVNGPKSDLVGDLVVQGPLQAPSRQRCCRGESEPTRSARRSGHVSRAVTPASITSPASTPAGRVIISEEDFPAALDDISPESLEELSSREYYGARSMWYEQRGAHSTEEQD